LWNNMKRRSAATVWREAEWYVSQCLEVDVASQGETEEEALANLIYGVQSRKGFIVLTGEVGTGKTTMLECMREYLESQYIEYASLFNSRINPQQFFEMIAYDLDLRCDRTSKTEVLFALNNLLIQQANEGRTSVLIVDEAHNLDWDVLEEIRLLGEYDEAFLNPYRAAELGLELDLQQQRRLGDRC